MSNNNRNKIAEAFGQEIDPLKEFEQGFESANADVWQPVVENKLKPRGITSNTLGNHERAWDQWTDYMAGQGRHPACPNDDHVSGFAHYLKNKRGNSDDTVERKLTTLNLAYEYWQADNAFPHPADYNPVRLAMDKVSLEDNTKKDQYDLSIDEMGRRVRNISHIKDQAVIVTQTKCGLRQGEIRNMRIEELHLEHDGIEDTYPEMGTHPELEQLEPDKDCVYVPPRENTPFPVEGRDGNKSKRPRVIPIDDETAWVLQQWLLIRPDCGVPYVFLSDGHAKLGSQAIIRIWKRNFEEFKETDRYKAIRSHYGRHFFSDYWRVTEDLNRQKLAYLRGDMYEQDSNGNAMDEYMHPNYRKVEEIYRERIFKFGVL